MINHQFHQKQQSCPKHPTLWCRRETQIIHKWWTPRPWPHCNLKVLPFGVFFHNQTLANILSFSVLASKFSITIDTELDLSLNVHIYDGTRMIFKKCGGGLYYFDTTNKAFAEDQTTDYIFLNTVDSNNYHFTDNKSKDRTKREYYSNL